MVTGRFGRHTGQVIDAEETNHKQHDQEKHRQARNFKLPGIAF